MVFKLFIDINIIVDLLDADRPGHNDAVKLIEEAEAGNCKCFVTESVLNTTAYLVRKDYNVRYITKMFGHLLSFIQLLPVFTNTYQVALIRTANDLEDAALYQTAIENRLDYFVTGNVADFKKIIVNVLPIKSSAEILELMQA